VREVVRRDAAAILAEVDAGTGEGLTLERIAWVSCPVTCLLGELSDPVFAKSIARVRRALPRAAVRTVAGAGYGIHVDQPAAFVDAVAAAVASAEPSPARS
jgi:pimeloyl-ACP methyl ester carboxylesterase